MGAGLAIVAAWPAPGGLAGPALGAAVSGIGFGLFQVPNNRNMFLSAPAGRSAAAGGMQGTSRLIGQTIGALVIGLLFALCAAAAAPRAGLALASLFAVAAALVSAMSLEVDEIGPEQAATLNLAFGGGSNVAERIED